MIRLTPTEATTWLRNGVTGTVAVITPEEVSRAIDAQPPGPIKDLKPDDVTPVGYTLDDAIALVERGTYLGYGEDRHIPGFHLSVFVDGWYRLDVPKRALNKKEIR